jgi:DNA polymerase IV (DinB-like DNA polymerase)
MQQQKEATGRTRIVLHIDLDAFYANVEINANPSLRGKPVVVGANPKGGRGRGVVITASYEARKFGLKSGMPISKAFKLAPGAVYLGPRFPLYSKVSARVMDLLRSFGDELEQSGIDEAFLDVSSKASTIEEAENLAREIKKKLLEDEGFTCSIGIGPNKTSAKIASDMQKPDGLTVIPLKEAREFLAPLPVSAIPGVGPKTREFLKEHEINAIGELQKIPGRQLVKWFGKGGVWLWGVAQGTEELPVLPKDIPRSMSVERTFDRDVKNYETIRDTINELSKELIRRLKLGNLYFKVAGIRVRFRGFETHTREKKLVEYSESLEDLLDAANSLIAEFKSAERFFRLVGVRVSDIKRGEPERSTLDVWVVDEKKKSG